jgi:hypothetical protein
MRRRQARRDGIPEPCPIEGQAVRYRLWLRNQICARVCARDAAGQPETVETQRTRTDARRMSAEVNMDD